MDEDHTVEDSTINLSDFSLGVSRIAGLSTQFADKNFSGTPSWIGVLMDGPVFQFREGSILAEAEFYTVAFVEKTNPAWQVSSASLIIRSYYADVI